MFFAGFLIGFGCLSLILGAFFLVVNLADLYKVLPSVTIFDIGKNPPVNGYWDITLLFGAILAGLGVLMILLGVILFISKRGKAAVPAPKAVKPEAPKPQFQAPQAPQAPYQPPFEAPRPQQFGAPEAFSCQPTPPPAFEAPAPQPEWAPAPEEPATTLLTEEPKPQPAFEAPAPQAPAFEEPAPAPQAPAFEAPAPQAPAFCFNCGAKLTPGAAFCPNCGNKIQ